MPFHDGLRAQRIAALGALILVTACGGAHARAPDAAMGPGRAGAPEPEKAPPLEEQKLGLLQPPSEVAAAIPESPPPPPGTEAPAVAALEGEAGRPDTGDGKQKNAAVKAGAADPLASGGGQRGQVRGATATSSGTGLSPELIRNVIRQSIPRFNACYRKELAKKPELGGAMVTGFTISARGTVSDVQVTQSNLQNAELAACVVEVVRSLQFPPPEGGGTIQVRYPLTMSPEQGS